MLPWDALARDLSERVRVLDVERQAQQQALHYQAWARGAVDVCLEDLTRELASGISRLADDVRRNLTVVLDTVRLDTVRLDCRRSNGGQEQGGAQRVLSMALSGDQVHIHGQWRPGSAPTVHLLWSRRRQGRYCQMVPLSGGRLMPVPSPQRAEGLVARPFTRGYRIVAPDGSGHEISSERLIFRALGLLANRAG